MLSARRPSRHGFIVWLCIIATLLNTPHSLQAAEAIEIQRPRAADSDLSVSIEEDVVNSNSIETIYNVRFKNLTDHEIEYDGLSLQFPDMEEQPIILTPEEAERFRRERESIPRTARAYSSGYHSSPIVINNYSPARRGGGDSKEARTVLAVLLIALFAFVIVAAIASSIREQNKMEREKATAEAKAATRDSQNPTRPIRLLRYQETTRQIIIRNDSAQPIKSVIIEVLDRYENKRKFKANMGNNYTS